MVGTVDISSLSKMRESFILSLNATLITTHKLGYAALHFFLSSVGWWVAGIRNTKTNLITCAKEKRFDAKTTANQTSDESQQREETSGNLKL